VTTKETHGAGKCPWCYRTYTIETKMDAEGWTWDREMCEWSCPDCSARRARLSALRESNCPRYRRWIQCRCGAFDKMFRETRPHTDGCVAKGMP
jgi:hypothetical protein